MTLQIDINTFDDPESVHIWIDLPTPEAYEFCKRTYPAPPKEYKGQRDPEDGGMGNRSYRTEVWSKDGKRMSVTFHEPQPDLY